MLVTLRGKGVTEQMRPQSKNKQTAKSAENAGDQVVIEFSFTRDCLKEWREFSGPITERSNAKPMQSRITFDTVENCSK